MDADTYEGSEAKGRSLDPRAYGGGGLGIGWVTCGAQKSGLKAQDVTVSNSKSSSVGCSIKTAIKLQ